MSKSNQACIKIVNRNGYLFLSVSWKGIASLLGRSVTGLDTYLHQLTEDEDIAAVRAKAGL